MDPGSALRIPHPRQGPNGPAEDGMSPLDACRLRNDARAKYPVLAAAPRRAPTAASILRGGFRPVGTHLARRHEGAQLSNDEPPSLGSASSADRAEKVMLSVVPALPFAPPRDLGRPGEGGGGGGKRMSAYSHHRRANQPTTAVILLMAYHLGRLRLLVRRCRLTHHMQRYR